MLKLKHINDKVITRFWLSVNIGAGTDCWIWKAGFYPSGYGRFSIMRRGQRAHRVAWVLTHFKEIPEGLVIMHTCDNPKCVNPSHLKLGTQGENVIDTVNKGRFIIPKAKSCKRGHDTSFEGARNHMGQCKQCEKIRGSLKNAFRTSL